MRKIGVIAGGGTGGHLYPGLSVVKEFLAQVPDLEVHFVGSSQGLESKIIPPEGFPLHLLPVGGLIRTGWLSKIKTLLLLPLSFFISVVWILRWRPRFVLGIGGFAAGPFVLAASFLVRNTYIWEPNAIPGVTNRWLSHFVKKAFVVFDRAKQSLKSQEIVTTGLPVRSAMTHKERVPSDRFRVLVFGGSQGARPLNFACRDAFEKYSAELKGVELVHQTGALDFHTISGAYRKLASNDPKIECFEYIDNMATVLQWADLVISRGGAGSISEIIACRKASVIIPLPTAADNHQEANAKVLSDVGAGELLLQKNLSPEVFRDTILKYKTNPALIEGFESKLRTLQRPNGAGAIVGVIRKDTEL